MQGWWVTNLWHNEPMLLVSWVVWVIVSIVLHELAHGWAAIRLGDRTPIEMGHMTWNPLVHMGRTSLIVFAIVGIAWGMMPVNPSRLRGRYGDAWVSLAGPAMNLALALLLVVVGGVWVGRSGFGAPDDVFNNMTTFFVAGASLNLFLMAFNLLPIPPFDGSRVLAAFSPAFTRLMATEKAQFAMFILFALMFFGGAGHLFSWAFGAGGYGIAVVAAIVG